MAYLCGRRPVEEVWREEGWVSLRAWVWRSSRLPVKLMMFSSYIMNDSEGNHRAQLPKHSWGPSTWNLGNPSIQPFHPSCSPTPALPSSFQFPIFRSLMKSDGSWADTYVSLDVYDVTNVEWTKVGGQVRHTMVTVLLGEQMSRTSSKTEWVRHLEVLEVMSKVKVEVEGLREGK